MTGNTSSRHLHQETEAAVIPLDLLQGPALVVVFPLFVLALLLVIAPDGVDLDEMLKIPRDPDRARGVREEEPARWRVDLLSRRTEPYGTGAADPAVQAKAPVITGARAPRGA
jgi:hypothetical protein